MRLSIASIPHISPMGAAYYRSGQAATMLGISAHLVRRLCKAGLIEAELSDGDQWRVPDSEIERLKHDGIPPIPSLVDAAEEDEEEESDSPGHGLLAPPSKNVVTSAEDVIMAENRLNKLRVEKATEETRDWFRERKRLKAETRSKQRKAELEKNARAEAERARSAWLDSWLAHSLRAVPRDAPPDTRLAIRRTVAETLADLGPQNAPEVIMPLLIAGVAKALHPWRKGEETAQAIKEACGALPYDAKGYSTPTVWDIRASEVASAAIRQLAWDSPYDEKLRVATAAVRKICSQFEDIAMRERLLRSACVWDIDYSQQDDAREAIRKAFEELPAGTSERMLERAREQALLPYREARKQGQKDAEQKQRVERHLPHVRRYLGQLQEAGGVDFEDYLDLWNFAERITGRVRNALLEKLEREDLSDDEIEAVIEQVVEESLDDRS